MNQISEEEKKPVNESSIPVNCNNIMPSQTIETNYPTTNPHLGAFFHWGVYSIFGYLPRKFSQKNFNGAEWYYKRLSNPKGYGSDTADFHKNHFNGKPYHSFIPELQQRVSEKSFFLEWAEVLKQKGVSYAILTAKHHDGINLFPTKVRGAMYATERDFVQEFKEAMQSQGIAFGIYFSLMEWPKGQKIDKYVESVLHPQLMELLDRYQPSILWTDGDWVAKHTVWKSETFLDSAFKKYPNLIINDRWGKDLSFKPTYNVRYNFSDRHIPETPLNVSWEHINALSCSWGYAETEDITFKTAEELTSLYKEVRAKNGTFCLSFGPDSYGKLNPKEVEPFLKAEFPLFEQQIQE